MVRGLEHFCCEDRQRESELLSREKRRLWGDLPAAFQYLKEICKKEGERLFTQADSDRTRGKTLKLKEERFGLDARKKFFPVRVVRHWHRLSREAPNAPSSEVFEARLDRGLSNLFYWKMSLPRAGGVELDDLSCPL